MGEGHGAGVEMGPLITQAAQRRVERLIGEGVAQGARGGGRARLPRAGL